MLALVEVLRKLAIVKLALKRLKNMKKKRTNLREVVTVKKVLMAKQVVAINEVALKLPENNPRAKSTINNLKWTRNKSTVTRKTN